MPSTNMELTEGVPEGHPNECPCAGLGNAGECLGIIGRIDLYDNDHHDVDNAPAITTSPRTTPTDVLHPTNVSNPLENLPASEQNLNLNGGSNDDGVFATAGGS